MNRKKLLNIGDKLLTALIVLFFIITILFKVRYIETGSMKPTLQVGSIVYVNPFSYSEKRKPGIGDIAMYRSSTGMEYIHRIVDVTEDGKYIFKGDNNSAKDFFPYQDVQKMFVAEKYAIDIKKDSDGWNYRVLDLHGKTLKEGTDQEASCAMSLCRQVNRECNLKNIQIRALSEESRTLMLEIFEREGRLVPAS